MSNLAEQYAAYFESFKTAISSFVELVKAFTKTIQDFVDGFKKNITAGETFEDLDDSELGK
jgi:phage host-nuclease inhibitor protein Gam